MLSYFWSYCDSRTTSTPLSVYVQELQESGEDVTSRVTITCPTCRHHVSLPLEGVANLQVSGIKEQIQNMSFFVQFLMTGRFCYVQMCRVNCANVL